MDPLSPQLRRACSAQFPKTLCCCLDIPVGIVAVQLCRAVCKSCADQHPMGHGLGGDNGERTPKQPGLYGNIHIKDLPR